MMKLYVAQSIKDYIDIIEDVGSIHTEKWYRGQSKCEYRLTPSALRRIYAIEDQRGNKISPPRLEIPCSGSSNVGAFLPIDQMVMDFKQKAEHYIEYKATSNIEWECIAQHYGVPTRILDWTTDAITALFFAVDNCLTGDNDQDDIKYFFDSYGFGGNGGAVFVIDPLEINRLTVPIKNFKKNPIIF